MGFFRFQVLKNNFLVAESVTVLRPKQNDRRSAGRFDANFRLADGDPLVDVSPAALIAIRAVWCIMDIDFGADNIVARR